MARARRAGRVEATAAGAEEEAARLTRAPSLFTSPSSAGASSSGRSGGGARSPRATGRESAARGPGPWRATAHLAHLSALSYLNGATTATVSANRDEQRRADDEDAGRMLPR